MNARSINNMHGSIGMPRRFMNAGNINPKELNNILVRKTNHSMQRQNSAMNVCRAQNQAKHLNTRQPLLVHPIKNQK